MRIEHIADHNKASFGIMLRDTIGKHGEADDTVIKGSKMLGVCGLKKKLISKDKDISLQVGKLTHL